MKADERRKAIVNLLASGQKAISGSALSEQFGVSRQIIVQDITILRGAGYDILSTHNGYIIQQTPLKERVFKVHHTTDQTEDELNLIVDLGGCVQDVQVNHRVYGKMRAPLNIRNRRDVQHFMDNLRTGKSTPLMNVTSGYHFHTISAEQEEILDEIEAALSARGFLAELFPYEIEE